MFRQIRRTLRTFSIQYFRTDVCPKIANLESRKNDFERVTTFIPTNYNSVNDGESYQVQFENKRSFLRNEKTYGPSAKIIRPLNQC